MLNLADTAYTFGTVVGRMITSVFDPLIPVIITLSLVYFLWGVIKFTTTVSEKGKTDSKSIMWWGIIILAVSVSVWGIITVLKDTFSEGDGSIYNPVSSDDVPTY